MKDFGQGWVKERGISVASALLLSMMSLTVLSAESAGADLVQPRISPVSTSEIMLEHIVIRVDDLEQAINDYESLGFTVTPGGEHEGGISRNALIHFPDKTFIELIEIQQSIITKVALNIGLLAIFLKNGNDHIKYRFVESINYPEGFIDSAILSHAIVSDTQLARQRGLKTTAVTSFERQQPNGDMIRWDIMSPLSTALPFLRGPNGPKTIIEPHTTTHDNGAVGLAKVTYAVANLQTSLVEYEYLLGKNALVSATEDKSVVSFKLGSATIYLIPSDEYTEPDDFVGDRRDMPVQLTLRTLPTKSAAVLPLKRTHGAKIFLEPSGLQPNDKQD